MYLLVGPFHSAASDHFPLALCFFFRLLPNPSLDVALAQKFSANYKTLAQLLG